jgi:hypothetical protein
MYTEYSLVRKTIALGNRCASTERCIRTGARPWWSGLHRRYVRSRLIHGSPADAIAEARHQRWGPRSRSSTARRRCVATPHSTWNGTRHNGQLRDEGSCSAWHPRRVPAGSRARCRRATDRRRLWTGRDRRPRPGRQAGFLIIPGGSHAGPHITIYPAPPEPNVPLTGTSSHALMDVGPNLLRSVNQQ